MINIKSIFPKLRRADKKVITARALVIVLMLANLGFIWYNSAQNASDSTDTSKSITRHVAPHVVKDYEKLPDEKKEEKITELNPKLRSLAHSLEYVPLGILVFLLGVTLFELKGDTKKAHAFALAIISALLAMLFALIDETHQIFVDGRSFEMKDIGLDMLGMTCGYIFSAAVFYIKLKISDKSNIN